MRVVGASRTPNFYRVAGNEGVGKGLEKDSKPIGSRPSESVARRFDVSSVSNGKGLEVDRLAPASAQEMEMVSESIASSAWTEAVIIKDLQ